MPYSPRPGATPADYLIKQKDPQTGKNVIVGRGWRKDGQYGPFISLSIGPKGDQQSYIMVKPPEDGAARTGGYASPSVSTSSGQRAGTSPGAPKLLSESEWAALAKAAQSGPTGPKETGPSDMPDDDIGF